MGYGGHGVYIVGVRDREGERGERERREKEKRSYELVHPNRPKHRPMLGLRSVQLSIGTPLCPYGIAYSRACALSHSRLSKDPF